LRVSERLSAKIPLWLQPSHRLAIPPYFNVWYLVLDGADLPNKIGLHEWQNIVNNAFVYACAHNRIEAARLLLQKGAEIDAIPPGFDYAGTGLHYAALRGHRQMVEFLLDQGADPNIKDTKVQSTAAGWADYGGHKGLRLLLEKTGLKDQ